MIGMVLKKIKTNKMQIFYSFLFKYWMLLSAVFVIFTPIIPLLWLIISLCFLDMVTAYLRDTKKNRKLQKITSSKLRKTSIKTVFYVLTILMAYAIPFICFDALMLSLTLARFTAFAFASNEFFSIAENMTLITGNNVFILTVKKVVNRITDFINDKIEDKSKEK